MSFSNEFTNEEDELAEYVSRLLMTEKNDLTSEDEINSTCEPQVATKDTPLRKNVIPEENRIEKTLYIEPKRGTDPETLCNIIQNLHSMRECELRVLLKDANLSAQGTRKQLLDRVRKFYRKEYATYRIRSDNDNMPSTIHNKTLRYFEYLVVIDFECTCTEIIYDYPHEIIELPAVLVDVQTGNIVDKFQSFVRPERNPILDPFCISLCGITQESVDNAPVFREVLQSFRLWMRKHNLGEENHRFAFVTDGPHDFWKFFQFQCILSGIESVPHEFRCWINIKNIFEHCFGKLEKTGKNELGVCVNHHFALDFPVEQPKVTSIEKMLKAYNKEFSGQKHSGIDDATNLAIVVKEMLRDRKNRIELRINQRITRKPDKLENAHWETSRTDDHHIWVKKLPLMYHFVTREDFLSGQYLDCDSCDELDD